MATTSPGSAEAEVGKQVVVVRLPSKASRVKVQRHMGDTVALVEFLRPPADLMSTLSSQTGRYYVGAHRRSVIGDRAVVALELSSETVSVAQRRVESGPAVILTFRPETDPRHPDHRALFGVIPGVYEVGRLPVASPPEPSDAPCPGRIANDRLSWASPAAHVDERFPELAERACAEYLAGRLATEAMNAGRSLAPFERWAYAFDAFRPWPEHRRAYAVTALVVGALRVRLGYYPEAEVVYTTPGLFKARSLHPYQGLGLAHLELERGRLDAVRPLVDPLLATSAADDVKEQGGIIAVLAETRAHDIASALAAADRAWSSLRSTVRYGAMLATLTGEVALASGDTATAQEWFERAVSVEGSRAGHAVNAASLRLADFAAAKGDFRRAKRIIARVQPHSPCETALHDLRRKVMGEGRADAVIRMLEKIVTEPVCPAELRDARFALARSYVQVGLPERAVPLAWQLREELPEAYRYTREPLPLLEGAFRSAVERLVRHRRWEVLIRLYEEHVAEKGAMALLDGPTLVAVARAYIAAGAPVSASSVLTTRLALGVDERHRREISIALIEAYIREKDVYRADLVLNYLAKTLGGELPYTVALSRARLHLLRRQPKAALAELEGLQLPEGDPRSAASELRAIAELALDHPVRAARHYVEALSRPNPRPLEQPAAVVRTLSQCARADRGGDCGELYRRAGRAVPLGDRLRTHAERLGWLRLAGGSRPAALASGRATTTQEKRN